MKVSDPRLDAGETLVTVEFVDVNGHNEVCLRQAIPTTEHRYSQNYGCSVSLEKFEKLFGK